ncbi:MAG TPA: hypothetical protein VKU19_27625 [Bryobacteraceae bacterium]|nr:hypothetical protein [Bryobacteraceae bacterium]
MEIDTGGWVEKYVRRRLPASDAARFEEHYFVCDQCYADVEAMEQLLAGIKDASRRGLLDPAEARLPWLMPAFVLAAALSVVMGIGLAFLAFGRLPRIESDLKKAQAEARAGSQWKSQMEQLAAGQSLAEANVPVVILEANRGAPSPNTLKVDARTRRVLLWLDVPPQAPGTRYKLTLATADSTSLTITGLERNANGALAVSVPVSQLPDNSYSVRLYLDRATAPSLGLETLVGEYRLAVIRP